MKKLTLKDAIRLSQILKNTDLSEETDEVLKAYQIPEEDSNRKNEVGIAFIKLLCALIGEEKNEEKVYLLLSGPFEMTAEEVGNIPIVEIGEKLKELAKENDLLSFFDSARKVMNSNSMI